MSAVLERQISEGYPVEGMPFEPPQTSKDREVPLYVTVLGSVITPDIIQDRPWMKAGGMEVNSPCLRYVKHYLRKGRITPVLKDTHNWVSQDYWDKATGKDASYFLRPIPQGYVAPDKDEFGSRSVIPPMYGKLAYPAEQIDSILNGSSNSLQRTRLGVVHLTSLKGASYNPTTLEGGFTADPEIWRIQKAIFPNYPVMPTLLDETEKILLNAQVHTMLRPVVDQMLISLSQFRSYAAATVEHTHYMMRELGSKSQVGYIPRYSDLDFVLLEQLGWERQDMNIRKEKDTSPQHDPELARMQKELILLQLEEQRAITAERRAQKADIPVNQIDESTMAATPIHVGEPEREGHGITNDAPEGQEAMAEAFQDAAPVETDGPSFECDCEFTAKSLAGLKAHQRNCKLTKEV